MTLRPSNSIYNLIYLNIIVTYILSMSIPTHLLKISPQVIKAIKQSQPIVALQSTIISHGMPYPRNLQCALQVQSIIHKNNAIPATIALIQGQVCIGLQQDQIHMLAKASNVRKISRRDMPYAIARKQLGSTTVSATMICSSMAGIDIFVTGGMGGVHRDVAETMDISADLREIGRTPVTVVSAGVKSILDIPRTIQYLETQGVPVITYGSQEFPAFYSPKSGIKSPLSLNSIQQIAEVLHARKMLQLQNGILVGVPPPDSGNGKLIEQCIQKALKQAHQKGIKGAATTPFILKKVQEYSGGVSLQANIALIKRNAEVGAQLAVKYNKLLKSSNSLQKSYRNVYTPKSVDSSNNRQFKTINGSKLIVIGGSGVDYRVQSINGPLKLRHSCQGQWSTVYGGIGRNIAQVSSRLGTPTTLVTVLGDDSLSNDLRNNIIKNNIDLYAIQAINTKTATYLQILDENKDMMLGICDMHLFSNLKHSHMMEAFFNQQQKKGINSHDIVVVDANVCEGDQNLLSILKYLNKKGYFIVFQCKGKKTLRILKDQAYRYISLLRMNHYQSQLLVQQLQKQTKNQIQITKWIIQNVGSKYNSGIYTKCKAIITNGTQPIQLIYKEGVRKVQPVNSDKVVKTTGAGDTLTGSICALMLQGKSLQEAVDMAIVACKMTVQSHSKQSTISDKLSLVSLEEQYHLYKASRTKELL